MWKWKCESENVKVEVWKCESSMLRSTLHWIYGGGEITIGQAHQSVIGRSSNVLRLAIKMSLIFISDFLLTIMRSISGDEDLETLG